MICPACGKTIADGSKFCTYCGHDLSLVAGTVSPGGTATAVRVKEAIKPAVHKAKKPRLKGNRAKILKIAGICFLSLLMVAAVGFAAVKSVYPSVCYINALKELKNGEYDKAVSAFAGLGTYMDSPDRLTEAEYLKAVDLLNNGSYDDALALFEQLGDYKDCQELAMESKYQKGIELFGSGNYLRSIEIFGELGDFEDSADYLKEANYQYAHRLMSAGSFGEALTYLSGISDYKDSGNLIQVCDFNVMLQDIDAQNWQDAYANYTTLSTAGYEGIGNYTVAVLTGYIGYLTEGGDYQNALDLINSVSFTNDTIGACKDKSEFNLAVAGYNAGNYSAAAEVFAGYLDNDTYSDSATDYLYLCAKAIYETDESTAIDYFRQISDYKDASDYIPKETTSSSSSSSSISLTSDMLQGTWVSPWYVNGNIRTMTLTFNGNSLSWVEHYSDVPVYSYVGTGTYSVSGDTIYFQMNVSETSGQGETRTFPVSTQEEVTYISDSELVLSLYNPFYRQ